MKCAQKNIAISYFCRLPKIWTAHCSSKSIAEKSLRRYGRWQEGQVNGNSVLFDAEFPGKNVHWRGFLKKREPTQSERIT